LVTLAAAGKCAQLLPHRGTDWRQVSRDDLPDHLHPHSEVAVDDAVPERSDVPPRSLAAASAEVVAEALRDLGERLQLMERCRLPDPVVEEGGASIRAEFMVR
jgi:hypothetical protein